LSLCAVAVLAGCGGADTPLATTQQSPPLPFALVAPPSDAHRDRGPSWMAASAKAQNLLYTSDGGANDVRVYSYPKGKLVGTLANLQSPAGVCGDAAGDVWIVESASATIVEYAHGAKVAKAMLRDPGAFLLGCSVDPTTGDLGVTDLVGGNVAVYAGAHGTPKTYRSSHLSHPYFCGYDDKGNLFIDGVDAGYSFQFFELPSGSKALRPITLNAGVDFPGGVQWDGQYVAIGDQDYQDQHTSAIYQVSVAGSSGTIEGTTLLTDSCDVVDFGIVGAASEARPQGGAEVIAPDVCQNNVRFYAYPSGGTSTKTLDGFQYPVGATVSLAK
jgi:hypothetical protein